MDNTEGKIIILKQGEKEIKRKNYTNQRFGRLVVIETLYGYKKTKTGNYYKGSYCECKCDCGNTKIILTSNLISGKIKSCGCLERESRFNRKHGKDLTGRKFGKLTAQYPTDKRASNSTIIWHCICECGNERDVSSGRLLRGDATSCGCDDFINVKIDITGKRFGHLIATSRCEKINNKTAWLCRCDCGNLTRVPTTDLTTGNTKSCGKCSYSRSNGELLVSSILDQQQIQYYQNYNFKSFKTPDTNHYLYYDFYLPDFNTCIEYDGKQHYQSVSFWGGDEAFERRKFLDNLKTDYCIKNNIPLLRIPYTDKYDTVYEKILNIINPVTTTLT